MFVLSFSVPVLISNPEISLDSTSNSTAAAAGAAAGAAGAAAGILLILVAFVLARGRFYHEPGK